ncbi:MAG: metallo-beta-lactamase family protein [Porticoccaceae bacterium]
MDPEISAVFMNAGHTISACSIELTIENKTLVFLGGVGRENDALMYPATTPKKADYVLLESSYGNRLHPTSDAKLELEMYINNTVKNGESVIILCFAVERAQMLMYLLWQLREGNSISNIPYVIDSPMGVHI